MIRRNVVALAAAVLAGLICIQGNAQTPGTKPEHYFVTATPTTNPKGYPCRIYDVRQEKLHLVREVAASKSATGYVIEANKAIFIVPWDLSSGPIAAIDRNHPETPIAISLSHNAGILADAQGIVEDNQGHEALLLTTAPKTNPAAIKPDQVLLFDETQETLVPAKGDGWQELSHPFWTASITGPTSIFPPTAMNSGNTFSLLIARKLVTPIAPAIPSSMTSPEQQYAVFSSDEYLVALPIAKNGEAAAMEAATLRHYLLYDRKSNAWQMATIEGNASEPKFFGQWITWAIASGGKTEISPGRSSERSIPTSDMPDVSALYSSPDDSEYVYHPGVLVLTNPRTKAHVRVVTSHEDSEVLSVDENTVIYRVDTTIYQARISAEAKTLGTPMVIAKDDDVPEIHWAFAR